ncbi:Uncharacterised protein [Mycobacteroides abscessus]|nr:Uncharacterised protein [Mycobacteroides abscessus]
MPPTMPMVSAFSVACSTASCASVVPDRPKAAPAAAASAVSRTAVPVAVSHPKKAEPILMPPYSSFSRATTASRSGATPPVAGSAARSADPPGSRAGGSFSGRVDP